MIDIRSRLLETTRRAWLIRAGASVGCTRYRPEKSLNPL